MEEKKRAARARLDEKERRIRFVLDEFAKYTPTYEIIDRLMAENNIAVSTARFYLTQAYKRLKEMYLNDDKESIAAKMWAQLEDRLRDAIKNNRPYLAFQIQQEMAKIKGLYASEKIDITSKGEKINEITIKIVKPNNDKEEGK